LDLGTYKDSMGALRRQAARFRIFGYDAAGEVVAELTPVNSEIEWTVHLANKKADWYQFHLALDIDEAKLPSAAVSKRRNALVKGEDRKKLVINPGPRSIHGRNTSGTSYYFDSGKFFDQPVSLGELRTDGDGRLLVLGGFGLSQSAVGQPPLDFANNDGWHDDVADGPVDAKVIIDGKEIPVEGAWVVVGPPNYAPALKTVRTLYDLLYDRMVDWGLTAGAEMVSFERHIRPIFERFSGLQWVNQGFASFFGAGTPFDAALLLGRLADGSAGNREFRERIYAQFRNPARRGRQLGKLLWPQFYGDALDSLATPNDQNSDPSTSVPQGLASLSGLQLSWLQKWVAGDFVNDYDPAAKPITSLEEVPLSEQPQMLTEAALSYCLADAFHPGCEVTWPMRIRALYSSAFRIKRRAAGDPEPEYGEVMNPDIALSPLGPLNGAGPGDLTKWMAVPWQTDTASCLSGYSFFRTSESLPTFWPARVPNDVLRLEDYNILMDRAESNANRLAAFYRRADWFRGFTSGNDIEQMITDFHRLGIVEEREGPTDLPGVPTRVWVETGLDLPDPLSESAVSGLEAEASATMQAIGAPRRFTLRKMGQKHRD